jgi:hypothetical protein
MTEMTEATRERRGPFWTLMRRWPTAVALAAAALILSGGLGDMADAGHHAQAAGFETHAK